jgi:hypothetical protein
VLGEGDDNVVGRAGSFGDFADDPIGRQAGLVAGDLDAIDFLAHFLGRAEEAGMELDEDPGAGPVQPAGVQDVNGAQDAVDIGHIDRGHERKELGRRHRFAIAGGAQQALESFDFKAGFRA